MTVTEMGQLIVYVTDAPLDEAASAEVKKMFNSDVVVSNLLESLYDTSISTREAAQILGRAKTKLESLVESGSTVVVICRRRSEDLGTRSHFMASLCAAADQVYFRSNT
ncbi:MAG: hypothetical protein HY646_03070 [Acidobacteria bacterium]|nr:hypothetical protein [Acidobacteriota bacterium]